VKYWFACLILSLSFAAQASVWIEGAELEGLKLKVSQDLSGLNMVGCIGAGEVGVLGKHGKFGTLLDAIEAAGQGATVVRNGEKIVYFQSNYPSPNVSVSYSIPGKMTVVYAFSRPEGRRGDAEGQLVCDFFPNAK